MPARALWKGFLKVAEVNCAVALYSAASTSERIAFHMINRDTGNRVRRQFVDSETGKPVERDKQIKGYEIAEGYYVTFDPEEVAAVVPNSDKTFTVSAFIGFNEVDDVYFDKPYYLTPSNKAGEEAFALIREGMRTNKVAAIAQTVLFRRVRTVLIRAHGAGLMATTLNFDYEVRSAQDIFADIPDLEIKGEMLDLAKHIINTKDGMFDASAFDDRYEAALADLVKAKLEGNKLEARREPKSAKIVDLMAALRESAGVTTKRPSKAIAGKKRSKTRAVTPRRKSA